MIMCGLSHKNKVRFCISHIVAAILFFIVKVMADKMPVRYVCTTLVPYIHSTRTLVGKQKHTRFLQNAHVSGNRFAVTLWFTTRSIWLSVLCTAMYSFGSGRTANDWRKSHCLCLFMILMSNKLHPYKLNTLR